MSETLRLLVARSDGTPLLDHELAAGQSFEWHEHDPMLAIDQVGLIRLTVPPAPPPGHIIGDPAREMLERNWLIGLVENSGRAPEVTDAGYPPAEFVYEADGHRIEVTVREIT